MVEAGCEEVDEADIIAGLEVAHEAIKKQCEAIRAWAAEVGEPKMEFAEKLPDRLLMDKIKARFGAQIISRRQQRARQARARERSGRPQAGSAGGVAAGRRRADEPAAETAGSGQGLRRRGEGRPCARPSPSTRSGPTAAASTRSAPSACEVGVAPRTHGSGLFTRGQTQVLTLLTLGAARDEQRIDGLDIEESKRFMHHYKFPPFSVGEAGFMRGPGRREIGHGALAERALVPVIPDEEAFPYTIRLVSETLESNGSSSMASVCALHPGSDGRRRADRPSGGRHRHGSGQGEATTTSC